MTSAQRSVALAGILTFAFLGAIQALYGPLLPGLQRNFTIDTGTVGLIFTAHGLGALLGIFVPSLVRAPALAHRWLTVATALLLIGAVAITFAPTWPTTLAAVFVLAVGFGIHVIRLNSLFVAGFAERGMTMSQLLNAAFSIGSILGPIALALGGEPSQNAFGAVTVCALMVAPACWLADRSTHDVAGASLGRDQSAGAVPAHSWRLLIAFVALMSLVVGVENSIAGWTTTLALANGYTFSAAANLTAIFFGCIFTGRLLAAAFAHRARPALLVLGAIVCVALMMSIAVLSSAAPMAFAATGFALAPLFAGTLVWLGAALPTTRHANAFVIGGALIGSALFPPLVGRAIGSFGVASTPPAILCIALAALAAAS